MTNLGLKATVWRHVVFTPAEDVPYFGVCNSSRSTNSRDQEGSGGPAWIYDTPSVEDNVFTKECLDETIDKHKCFKVSLLKIDFVSRSRSKQLEFWELRLRYQFVTEKDTWKRENES